VAPPLNRRGIDLGRGMIRLFRQRDASTVDSSDAGNVHTNDTYTIDTELPAELLLSPLHQPPFPNLHQPFSVLFVNTRAFRVYGKCLQLCIT
jgi:hypothetical protein